MAKVYPDTDTSKAHSVHSVAAEAGISTKDIVRAADWSSESVFQKFYYKLEMYRCDFGIAVLSNV